MTLRDYLLKKSVLQNFREFGDAADSRRSKVLEKMIRHFSHRGGLFFTKIASNDIKTMFEIYDDIYFGGEIHDQLRDTDTTLLFKINASSTGKVSEGLRINKEYAIIISPNVFVSKKFSHYKGIKCPTRLECLMLVFEDELVNIIIDLWGRQSTKGMTPELKSCMGKRLFNHYDLPASKKARSQPLGKEGIYTYHSNSCYLDSLMMVLFSNDTIVNALLFSPISIPYESIVCGKKKLTKDQALLFAKRVREVLLQDYDTLQSGRNTKCSVLRTVLGECEPAISGGVMYNSAEVYSILSELFGLKMEIEYSVSEDLQLRSTVSTFDFMSADTAIEWNALDSNIIVFQNDMNPPIRRLNEEGLENGKVKGEYFAVFKERAFGETILDGRYVLFGVVVLDGVVYGQSSGSHYTSYYRGIDGKWLKYNDQLSKTKPVDDLPSRGVWEFSNARMPYMYFYKKA